MKKDIKEKIRQLTQELINYSYNYYNKHTSLIEDYEYDILLKELESLEEEYPEFKLENSPTTNVGFEPSEYLQKFKHEHPMLSLQNALNLKELNDWLERLKKDLEFDDSQMEKLEFFVEPKIDGVSISLIYENGFLQTATTRGNGSIGEDVTNNIKQIKNIPWVIEYKGRVSIRGEIFSNLETFKKVNEVNDNKFANPRNFASGSVRLLDPLEVKKRELSVFFYQVLLNEEGIVSSQEDTFKFLKNNNFPIYDNVKKIKGIKKINSILEDYEVIRNKLDFEIDGVVLKLNKYALWEKLGSTIKFPKAAIAFKFAPEIATTKLINIFPTVGRTGLVVYNAELEPVILLGSTIRFATLHNLEYIKKLDLRIGDIVEIKKSGEIIPKVIRPLISERKEKLVKWKEIKKCPICETNLIFSKTKNDQYCPNDECDSRKINQLIHFSSKEAIDLNSLGEKNIQLFFNLGILKSFKDFYLLKDKKEFLLKQEGFKERSINKIFQTIENSKSLSSERLLYALGIPHIGVKSARDLIKHYKSIDNLMLASLEELIALRDFGEVKAKSIFDFFNETKNKELIDFLKLQNVNMNYTQETLVQNKESKFYKKVVVVTGTYEDMSRKEAEKELEKHGATVRKSVSSKTDFLIAGEKPSLNKVATIDESKIINTNIFKDIL